MAGLLLTAALTAGSLLWGRVCHHIEREASRFIPIYAPDPDARLAFGYAMNQGRAGWQHKHVRHLIDLVYAGLDQR
jgi:hypothetical protein